jgi:hypothetical protein
MFKDIELPRDCDLRDDHDDSPDLQCSQSNDAATWQVGSKNSNPIFCKVVVQTSNNPDGAQVPIHIHFHKHFQSELNQQKPKPRPKTGRHAKTKRNEQLLQAWETRRYKTYKQLGDEFDGLTADAIRKALKNARNHRDSIRKQTPGK